MEVRLWKRCRRCGQTKEKSAFWYVDKNLDGRDYTCIECRKKISAATRARIANGIAATGSGRPARVVPAGTRWCGGCKQPLPTGDFSGKERTCRSCKRERHLARKYGLTKEDIADRTQKQGGVCAICRKRSFVYVDHNHETGKVRGLLCQQCNTGLGMFDEDPVLFRRAMRYISKDG